MTAGLPLIKSVLPTLARSFLLQFELSVGWSTTHTVIQKNSSIRNYSINNLEQRNGKHSKIVKSLKKSGLLIKEISETIKNKAKEQEGEFFSMILGKLIAIMLGNALTRNRVIRAGEDTIRADQNV